MTKAEIIKKIVAETGLGNKEVAVVVEAFMEEVRNSLADERENVYLRGFGTFHVKRRAAKTARNISKNTTIMVEGQTEKRRRATRWLLTSVRRDCARIVIRASKL